MELSDRDLQATVRLAKTQPDKTGPSRRNALGQLIEATHSSSVQIKIFAAVNIPDLFQDFTDLEEDAINAVYDLCEDHSAQVRMEGYRTLVSISKLEKKWVKRNSDVLVQLLQSDDPNEVNVVRESLIEHLQLDPRVTLGVLCDQIIPPGEIEPADPDELAMRDSLRALVLTFITDELKKGQLLRYVPPGSEAESSLVEGLISAIPNLGDSEVQLIVSDILLHLTSFNQRSAYGSALCKYLLDKAKKACTDEISVNNNDSESTTPPPIILSRSRPYFDILTTLFISKRQGKPEDLLKWYLPVIGKGVLTRLPPQDQILVLYNLAETLVSCKTELSTPKSYLQVSSYWFECLSKSDLSQERPHKACVRLLQAALHCSTNGWHPTPQVAQGIQELQRNLPTNGDCKDIQELIRSLGDKSTGTGTGASGKPSTPTPRTTPTTRPAGPSLSKTTSANGDSIRTRNGAFGTGAPSPIASASTSTSAQTQTQMRPGPSVSTPQSSNIASPSRSHQGVRRKLFSNANTTESSEEFPHARPAKRVKKGGGSEGGEASAIATGLGATPDSPSLLSRIGDSPTVHPTVRSSVHAHARPIPESRTRTSSGSRIGPRSGPGGGGGRSDGGAGAAQLPSHPQLSIKGAAAKTESRSNSSSAVDDEYNTHAHTTSLMNRLDVNSEPNHGPGHRNGQGYVDRNRRRNSKRGMGMA